MNNPNNQLRLPAEWEPQKAVMIAWPHRDTDWLYMLDDVQACYVKIVEALLPYIPLVIVCPDAEVPHRALAHLPFDHISFAEIPTNDTWTRDYGPISCELLAGGKTSVQLNDFKFNGWGLKFAADRDNLVTSRLHDSGLLSGEYVCRLGFVLEGGSIESDGRGTILTTSRCLLSPNRNGDLSRAQIESRLADYLGARKVLWLDFGALDGDDTDSHIDTLARLAPHDTILYCACDPADRHYDELSIMASQLRSLTTLEGNSFNLIELPLPEPIFDPDDPSQRLPATYANYLVTNGAVIMPSYGQPKPDFLASQLIKVAYPRHDVIQVDCRPLIRQHGSLHCATMQLI